MEEVVLCDFHHDEGKREVAVATEVTSTGMQIDVCDECLEMCCNARARLGLGPKQPLPMPEAFGSLLEAMRDVRHFTH